MNAVKRTVKQIDEQIEELELKRSREIRNQVVTVGQLLDIEDELDNSPNDIKWLVSVRLRKVLDKLACD